MNPRPLMLAAQNLQALGLTRTIREPAAPEIASDHKASATERATTKPLMAMLLSSNLQKASWITTPTVTMRMTISPSAVVVVVDAEVSDAPVRMTQQVSSCQWIWMLPTAMQKMMQKMMSTSLLCRMSTIRTLPATVPAARKAKVAVDGEAHVQTLQLMPHPSLLQRTPHRALKTPTLPHRSLRML